MSILTNISRRECRGKYFVLPGVGRRNGIEFGVLDLDGCETCGRVAGINAVTLDYQEGLAEFLEANGAKRLTESPGELSHDEDSGVTVCSKCAGAGRPA